MLPRRIHVARPARTEDYHGAEPTRGDHRHAARQTPSGDLAVGFVEAQRRPASRERLDKAALAVQRVREVVAARPDPDEPSARPARSPSIRPPP